jgi:hypothetical protein
VDDDDD